MHGASRTATLRQLVGLTNHRQTLQLPSVRAGARESWVAGSPQLLFQEGPLEAAGQGPRWRKTLW
jgi:hypothetical protein